ncbi:MAG: hypothetical protein PVH89_09785 [Gammaproteobacteria bacterium]|jgi:type II secretory pathway pseudopilin PulG
MTGTQPRRLTLIQILALIALLGVVLTIVLPRWLDGAGDGSARSEAEQQNPTIPARDD